MDIEEKDINKYFEQVKEFIKKNSSESKILKQIENINLYQNECFFLLDYSQNKIVYKKGFQNLLGYHNEEITNDFLFNKIHPDEVEIVKRIIKATISYCMEYPNNSSNNFLSIKYRLRKRDGTYINILNNSSIYNVDKKGRMNAALIKFTDISFIGYTKHVNWNFKATELNEIAFKELINKAYEGFFTSREIEIILKINKGFSNKIIGKSLNISVHTVAVHRKNIYRKSNCHNSDELILFCEEKGFL